MCARRIPNPSSRQAALRRVGKLMRRLLIATRMHMDEKLRPQEVTSAQLRMLYEIRTNPGVSGAQLARTTAVTPQSMQAMLARAVQRGWLDRGKSAENHRIVTFTLTAAGTDMLEHGEAIARTIEARVWKGIPVEEVEAVAAVLEQALANVDSHSTV